MRIFIAGVDRPAVDPLPIAVHPKQFPLRIREIHALNLDSLDLLPITRLNGEIELQHCSPHNIDIPRMSALWICRIIQTAERSWRFPLPSSILPPLSPHRSGAASSCPRAEPQS